MCKNDDQNGDSEYDSVDYESHPSLSHALEEARNRYGDEEDRRNTIETKIGILVSINAIVISFIISFGGIEEFLTVLIASLAMGSAVLGLYILWPRNYERPGDGIGEIFADASRNKADFEKQYLNDYRAAVEANGGENDKRYCIFQICSILTACSIGILFLSGLPLSDLCALLG